MIIEIRDKISDETQGMTLDQLRKYITHRLKKSPLKTIGRLLSQKRSGIIRKELAEECGTKGNISRIKTALPILEFRHS